MIPNHILILGAPHTGKLRTVETILTRSKKQPPLEPQESHSGLIVKTDYSTKYFSIDLNVLVDEFPDTRAEKWSEDTKLAALKKWYDEFLAEDCAELRQVLSGVFLCVNTSGSLGYIEQCLEVLGDLRDHIGSEDGHGFIAIVGTNDDEADVDEAIEDLVLVHGFEYLNLADLGYNEYKEQIGKDRLLEILDTHDWNNVDKEDPKYEENKRTKVHEMTTGLLQEDDKDVDLEDILLKLQIAKEEVHDLDPDQKEKYINKVISEVIDYI